MKVTPINRKFGRYLPGEEFELPDKVARVFINAKKLQAFDGYQTRALQAASNVAAVMNEYKQKAVESLDSIGAEWDASLHTSTKLKNSDGTWRKKPGRVKSED